MFVSDTHCKTRAQHNPDLVPSRNDGILHQLHLLLRKVPRTEQDVDDGDNFNRGAETFANFQRARRNTASVSCVETEKLCESNAKLSKRGRRSDVC